MESFVATEGFAIFTTGLLAILTSMVWLFSNYLAGMMLILSMIVLVFVGLFGVSAELFWLSIVGVLILLMAGMAVRGI